MVPSALLIGLAIVANGSNAAAESKDAKQSFDEAMKAVEANNWGQAVVLFEQAYDQSGRVELLMNIGSAQQQAGLLLEAAHSYERLLNHPQAPEWMRPSARRARSAVVAKTPTISVYVADLAPDDQIFLDGQPLPNAAPTKRVNPGRHTVSIKRAGQLAKKMDVTVQQKEWRHIRLRLRPAEDLPGANQEAFRASVPLPPPEDGLFRNPWFWVAVGAGLVVASGVTWALVDRGDPSAYSGNFEDGIWWVD